jgi:2,4-dienoyl-CoA reductase-like NADH-dependent reductase (Old Yellow Enzyme family)
MNTLNEPLALPCGQVLPNRLSKAAMTEGLGDALNRSTVRLERLYRRWAASGIGLLITGNVHIDRHHLERGGNVAIAGTQTPEALSALRAFATAAKSGGGRVWMQINHAGRQTPAGINPAPLAPSAVKLALPGNNFGAPRAMAADDIARVAAGFARAVRAAKETGFDGVQIHAAHGYLLNQFLSPRANRRTDEFGGSLENRARLLLTIVRDACSLRGPDFAVSVKLNSADFQKGGFAFEEALTVAGWLDAAGIDLLEISGGTYEQPKMAGLEGALEPVFESKVAESTRARESYFIKYAAAMRRAVKTPLMVTGGFRSRAGMDAALEGGDCDVIGVGRPLCGDPDAGGRLLSGAAAELPSYEKSLRVGPGWLSVNSPFKLIKLINGFGAQGWYYEQLLRLGGGLEPDLKLGVLKAFARYQANEKKTAAALEGR